MPQQKMESIDLGLTALCELAEPKQTLTAPDLSPVPVAESS